jgi:hypothetical protein
LRGGGGGGGGGRVGMWSNEEGKQPSKKHIKMSSRVDPLCKKSIKGLLIRLLFIIPNPGPVCFVLF